MLITTLYHALRAAVEQGPIPTNAAGVDPPKVIRQPMNILKGEQLGTFLEAIKADPIWHDFFYTKLTTSLCLDLPRSASSGTPREFQQCRNEPSGTASFRYGNRIIPIPL